MGLGANKIVKLFSFLFITVFFISNGRSQKLYIPVSNEEIIKIYKLGKKLSSGEYVYTDKDGNIRIKGKFHKNIPFGKLILFCFGILIPIRLFYPFSNTSYKKQIYPYMKRFDVDLGKISKVKLIKEFHKYLLFI